MLAVCTYVTCPTIHATNMMISGWLDGSMSVTYPTIYATNVVVFAG